MDSSNPASGTLNFANREYLESQYRQWRKSPSSVGKDLDLFFRGFDLAASTGVAAAPGASGTADPSVAERSPKRRSLIDHYRNFGHTVAHIDPLSPPPSVEAFATLEQFAIAESELDLESDHSYFRGLGKTTLRELIGALRRTYTSTIGVEMAHVIDETQREWLKERIEPNFNRTNFSRQEKLEALVDLMHAESLESFIAKNYTGAKRFSLEGCDTLIPMVNLLVEEAPRLGVEEVVMGMAHRGRLNVLANVLKKPYAIIFTEFDDREDWYGTDAGGDVKYHKGASVDHVTRDGKKIHLTMTSNPSHLEMVDPVVQGRARAKQDARAVAGSTDPQQQVLCLLMHGDAAFAGQGIVAETFQFSQLPAYETGGTIHIVTNNQVGFTTRPRDARSTDYCTEFAKVVQAPIFHVNAEDVEAAMHLTRIALEYRMKFRQDVVIDLVGYRRYGHNEGDEPAFTQPRMYAVIKNKKTIRELYANQLHAEGVLDEREFNEQGETFRKMLETAQAKARSKDIERVTDSFAQGWKGYTEEYTFDHVETGVPAEKLRQLSRKLNAIPDSFEASPKLFNRAPKDPKDPKHLGLLQRRLFAVESGNGIDWGNAEHLAFATLLAEGTPVRITGQDVRRGTFSHRHAVLVDGRTEEFYTPLEGVATGDARFMIFDSLLSELAVSAFEYGYALVAPHCLTIWEAQFGDFANCAQVIVDEFICSAEAKWERFNGLVMLLPHGYEGQGPDHSSARPERFLGLCADNNMQVVNPTTPAQFFHLLRRQMKRTFRKPLVVLTPKSLLRHEQAVSTVEELESGRFHEVLRDPMEPNGQSRVIFCNGKIYYDLLERRSKLKDSRTGIVRIEQLYPVPEQQIRDAFKQYRNAKEVLWVQEEPMNMGAWEFYRWRLRDLLGIEPKYIGRIANASPATGSHRRHHHEQEAILTEALGALAHATSSAH